ncbi:hypothetical protein AAVH_39745, partial [Aphelenchoides avenae]
STRIAQRARQTEIPDRLRHHRGHLLEARFEEASARLQRPSHGRERARALQTSRRPVATLRQAREAPASHRLRSVRHSVRPALDDARLHDE